MIIMIFLVFLQFCMSPWIFWTIQRYGVRAFIQHISLHIVGFSIKLWPWEYVGVLNDCVDLGVLKRAGERYFFEHPTIQDAFLAYNESDYWAL